MEKKLLLVDDEENILRSLKRLFRQESYTVFTANSAEEGLKILETNRVSVILSDQRMPGMLGSDFLSLVKDRHPNTIRIIMSGYTELESITSAINDGAVYKFLLKPWDDEKLLGHVRDAFSHYELKDSNLRLTKELMSLNADLEARVSDELNKNSIQVGAVLLSQRIVDRLPIAVFGVSNEGMIVLANEQAKQLVKNDSVIGILLDDIFPQKITDMLYDFMTNAVESESLKIEWEEQSKIIHASPLFFGDTTSLCVSVIE